MASIGDSSLSSYFGNHSLTYATNNTTANWIQTVPAVWSTPTMTKAKQDPLDWLRGEVERIVALGTLDE